MIRNQLHVVDPYVNFPAELYDLDLYGWDSEAPIFERVLAEIKPRLIIEVGTWKGASAVHMARLIQQWGLLTEIVCVDTWLGSTEFWTDTNDETRYKALDLHYGYPQVYYQFLANVIMSNCAPTITPFPQTSQNAAEWFKRQKIEADLIYIDGSHEILDVLADLRAWYPLVRKGGILFGDDLNTFLDVRRALEAFCKEQKLSYENIEDRKWILRK